MYGTSEVDIQFPTHIPVYLTYQTATVDDGKLTIRKDIYGYDSRTIAAIKSERGMVEMAERPRDNSSGGNGTKRTRPQQAQVQPQPRSGSFFDNLFGGNNRPPEPPRRIR
jgi:hypothetical protein